VRIIHASLIAVCSLCAVFVKAQPSVHADPAAISSQTETTVVTVAAETPAQQRIRLARKQLETSAVKSNVLNDLAIAYLRRERETRDASYLDQAENTLRQGLALTPGDFQLQKTQVELMLARHQYKEAKEKATGLNKHTPDDVMTYGYIAEADIALGDLDGADTAAQWMLNMRPNNIPGLLLGAKLRRLYKDPDGALDLLRQAYSETSPTEVEELASIANQMASIEIEGGKNEAAASLLAQAQLLFPNYPDTLDNLNKISLNLQNLPVANNQPSVLVNLGDTREPTRLPVALAATARSLPADGSKTVTFTAVPAKLLVPMPTETERMIHKAQSRVSSNSKDASGYAELGAAHFQRARETGDVSEYQLAEESLNKSLEIVSTDFTADEPLATLAAVCMGEHRFADALTYSQKALALGSGDVSPFAIIGDAYADMGEYDKAARAYARLTPRDMTLSPRAAYARDSRLAYLKFIAGDTPGAIAMMQAAVAEGAAAQLPSENLAWLYYELGEFLAQAGDTAAADSAYVTALTTHPGDYRALAALGKLRGNHGRYEEAIDLYRHAIAIVPMPIFVAELGDLYARTGNTPEAEKQYQLVEYIGLLGKINQVLHNRDLALFYADHDIKLAESLALARKELEVRHDIYSWDAVAWALFKNGRYAEAADASHKALQFGTKDSLLLFHAGMIAEHSGSRDQAAKLFNQALEANPHFHLLYSQQAEKHLGLMSTQAASGGNDAR
jgi:tetratricopeptide (TPR) repeat protein